MDFKRINAIEDIILEDFGNYTWQFKEELFIIEVIDKDSTYQEDCGCGCGGYEDEYYAGEGKTKLEAINNLLESFIEAKQLLMGET